MKRTGLFLFVSLLACSARASDPAGLIFIVMPVIIVAVAIVLGLAYGSVFLFTRGVERPEDKLLLRLIVPPILLLPAYFVFGMLIGILLPLVLFAIGLLVWGIKK